MSNEDILEILCEKVEGNCDLTWEEIVDYCDINISPITLRKAFSAAEYGGYAMLQKAKNMSSDAQLEKINAKLNNFKKNAENYK